MIEEILKDTYWSKSDAFVLPLTGIKKNNDFDIKSFLYWNEFTIEDYYLPVKIEYGSRYEQYKNYLREVIHNSKGSLIVQSFDFEGLSIIIYDVSNWSEDIACLMRGKYSCFSPLAQTTIVNYHKYKKDGKFKIDIHLYGCLYPNSKSIPPKLLDDMTYLEYVERHYVLGDKPKPIDFETAKIMRDCGEICSIPNKEKETLILDSQCVRLNEVD